MRLSTSLYATEADSKNLYIIPIELPDSHIPEIRMTYELPTGSGADGAARPPSSGVEVVGAEGSRVDVAAWFGSTADSNSLIFAYESASRKEYTGYLDEFCSNRNLCRSCDSKLTSAYSTSAFISLDFDKYTIFFFDRRMLVWTTNGEFMYSPDVVIYGVEHIIFLKVPSITVFFFASKNETLRIMSRIQAPSATKANSDAATEFDRFRALVASGFSA